jgi:glucose-6-phosphate dehydrogenase assembly protein OpcA
VSKKLVQLRNEVGAMTLGRVLTLIIVVDDREAEESIEAANEASRQHPCRIVVVVAGNRRGTNRMDAQIRVGGDAGASEVIVLRLFGELANHGQSVVVPLLLADSPVVAWWPHDAPADLRTDPIARMAQRRITDAAEARNPRAMLKRLAEQYQPGDTDISWTRITLWRGLLAAALDGPPYEPVTDAVVVGASDSPSSELLAGWLAHELKASVRQVKTKPGTGIVSVRMERKSGQIDLVRPGDNVATLTQPGQPDRRLSLKRRGLAECLADELRRLDADEVYAETLTKGLRLLHPGRLMETQAVRKGEAPSTERSRKLAARLARSDGAAEAAAMVVASPPPDEGDTAAVKKATARKKDRAPTAREQDLAKRPRRAGKKVMQKAEAESARAHARASGRASS